MPYMFSCLARETITIPETRFRPKTPCLSSACGMRTGTEEMFVTNIRLSICIVGSSPRFPIAHQQFPSGFAAIWRVFVGAENP